MAEDLRELRTSCGIQAKAIIAVVRGLGYERYDKYLQSKCERGQKYGIQLRPDAMEALLREFAPERLQAPAPSPLPTSVAVSLGPRYGKHRLNCRISCRLEDDEYATLQERMIADGFNTMQDLLTCIVREYINASKAQEVSHAV